MPRGVYKRKRKSGNVTKSRDAAFVKRSRSGKYKKYRAGSKRKNRALPFGPLPLPQFLFEKASR